MRAILTAIAAVTFLGAATNLLWSYPLSTKLHVATIAIGHCQNFHSLAGVKASELLPD
ncbi:hypothetical protein SAMN05216330_1196 [Bradyrhizobium sp. Ghvi]|uniref:hypothetical protein n=1 Tax=Bradyrhizobium sp. Ghvi TaxID=1855319 RepID=UPI0008E14516|nr:hypothetical protein [Bradyrhizobium sp. Ghvi]SFQ20261.1 hypothetical protein SAMN05216330_1196 [Bradyrhizobium sp. Ghvi]